MRSGTTSGVIAKTSVVVQPAIRSAKAALPSPSWTKERSSAR
jgi:hypothetical protein